MIAQRKPNKDKGFEDLQRVSAAGPTRVAQHPERRRAAFAQLTFVHAIALVFANVDRPQSR
jgi:hypothetical protein